MAPTLAQAIEVARRKAYVILDARGDGSIRSEPGFRRWGCRSSTCSATATNRSTG